MPDALNICCPVQGAVVFQDVWAVISCGHQARQNSHGRLLWSEGRESERDGVSIGNLMDYLAQQLIQSVCPQQRFTERGRRVRQGQRLPDKAYSWAPAEKMRSAGLS